MTPDEILRYFHMRIYLILSAHLGRLELLQRDMLWAIDEITHGTTKMDRYDYVEIWEKLNEPAPIG